MEYSDLVLSVPFHFFCALPAMYVTYELRNDRVWGRHWMARQVPFVTCAGNSKISIFDIFCANFCKFLAGSFSAVSKRTSARKYAFDSIFQAL